MANFRSLVKAQLFSTFKLNKILNAKSRRKRLSIAITVGLGLLLCATILGTAYMYAYLFAQVPNAQIETLLPQMFSLGALVCLIFSFYSTGNALYGTKDYDLLSSLPIKKPTIILSKLSFAFVVDFLLGILLISPSIIVYVQFGGVVTAPKMIRLFLMVVFLPVIPMAISVVLSALFLIISSRFKRSGLIQTVLFIFVFLAYLVLSFVLQSDNMAGITSLYFMQDMVIKGFLGWDYALIFIGINLLLCAVVFVITTITFDKINTIIKAKKRSKRFKLGSYNSAGLTRALLKKEMKMLLHYPMYAMNTLIGPIMCLIMPVVLIILANKIPEISVLTIYILPLIYPFSLFMSPCTACSLSVEGSSFWVMKTSPVSAKRIIVVKLLSNALLSVIPAIISCTIAIIFAHISFEYSILMVAIALLSALSASNVGLILNLLFPVMKWDSVNKPAKQSVSILLCSVCALVMTVITAVLFFVWNYQNLLVKYIITSSILLMITIVTSIVLALKGEKLLNNNIQL